MFPFGKKNSNLSVITSNTKQKKKNTDNDIYGEKNGNIQEKEIIIKKNSSEDQNNLRKSLPSFLKEKGTNNSEISIQPFDKTEENFAFKNSIQSPEAIRKKIQSKKDVNSPSLKSISLFFSSKFLFFKI